MANEKYNTVRILQSTKKNNLSAAAYGAIGFFAGMAFLAILVCLYLNVQNQKIGRTAQVLTSGEDTEINDAAAPDVSKHGESLAPETNQALQKNKNFNPAEDDSQHYDGNILNAFKHPKTNVPARNSGSPFASTHPVPIIAPSAAKASPAAKMKASAPPLPMAKSTGPAVKSVPAALAEPPVFDIPAQLDIKTSKRVKEPTVAAPVANTAEPAPVSKADAPEKETAAVS